jgi:hypothetical protein
MPGDAEYSSCPLFLVGDRWERLGGRDACRLISETDLVRGFSESPRDSVWLAHEPSWFAALASTRSRASSDRRLVVLNRVQETTHHVLAAWFRYVVVASGGVLTPRTPELLHILRAPNRDELFIGGAYDRVENVVLLYRGNVEPLLIPGAWFKAASPNPSARIDLKRLSIVDHGQTLRLGTYEISADAILYEFDENFRGRAKKRAIDTDDSLGGSIRRLRLQRGLLQTDLGLPVKTIARIERGEVTRPHTATLRRIAGRLRVPLEKLGSY